MKRALPCLVALAMALAIGGPARGQDRRVPGAGGTQRRLALVIGNDLYRVKPLANAVNDATAVAAALRRIGFDVGEPALNLGGAALERRVKDFVAHVNPGDVAFFFYAGHGVQIEGVNYLVPVDFDAEDEIDAKRKAYPVDDLRDRLETSGAALKLIVLDACRDNPFRWARARSGAGGLAAMQPGRGTLLAMATAPGKTASDNPGGKNGLFTAQLLKVIEQPGLKVKEVFERAQALVDEASGRKQLPWVEGIVIGDFYLVPPGAATTSGPPPTLPAVAPPAAGGGLDISDIEKQAAARAQWGQYQSRMAADFAKAEGFEKQAAQPADLKAAVWERFAQSYGQDNPFSVEDERLRQEARSRMERWKSEAPSQAVAPARQPVAPSGTGWVNPKDGLTYVSIPAASFEMGCVPSDSECFGSAERPRHTVRIGRGYWMAKTEVTVGAYQRFVSAAGRSMPSAPDFNKSWAQQDHPIVNVDWNDAKAFCQWSGGRLPSEAEWEYAARGGRAGTKYPWGDSISHDEANYGKDQCCGGLAEGRDRWENTSPVGSFAANGFGLHDMIGNVWEWVEDAYAGSYSGAPGDGSARESGSDMRALRGGSWVNYPMFLRVSIRNSYSPASRYASVGFRCVRDGN